MTAHTGWQHRPQITLHLPAALHNIEQTHRAAFVLRRWAEITRDPIITELCAEISHELTALADTLTQQYDDIVTEVAAHWSTTLDARELDDHDGEPDES